MTYAQSNISLGLNSLNALLVEDTKKPTPPSTFNANYRVDGTTELTWMGNGMEFPCKILLDTLPSYHLFWNVVKVQRIRVQKDES